MESLRSPERLRIGLTLSASLAAVVLGLRLWTGAANPLSSPVISVRSFDTAGRKFRALEQPQVATVSTRDDRVEASLVPPNPSILSTEVFVLNSANNFTLDHTLTWQKRGYTLTALGTVDGPLRARCDLLSFANKRFYRLSFYLGTDSQTADFQSMLNQLLAQSLVSGRRANWLTRVEIRTPDDCRHNPALNAYASSLSLPLGAYLNAL